MTDLKPANSGAITHRSPSQYHPATLCKQQLLNACSKYLECHSKLEALDRETDAVVRDLGNLTAAVAELLGPLDNPLVVEVDGVLVVINVAEGLLLPKQLTACFTVASSVEDLLGEEVVLG